MKPKSNPHDFKAPISASQRKVPSTHEVAEEEHRAARADTSGRVGSWTVTSLAGLTFACAVLQIGFAIWYSLIKFGGLFGVENKQQDPFVYEGTAAMLGATAGMMMVGILILFALGLLAAGYGILRREGWGRTLALGICVMMAIFLVTLPRVEPAEPGYVAGILLTLVDVAYMLTAAVILFVPKFANEFL